jgi:putative endonuclease
MSADKSARPPWWKQWFGHRSEGAAEKFLKGLGYRILARNYSCKLGELDVVALDGRCVVFVEVRSTAGDDPLRAALSVNPAKQRRLTRLAQYFLKHKRLLDRAARFDVLAISWPEDEEEPNITHYQNAFEAIGD